jgi:hypothetical protein
METRAIIIMVTSIRSCGRRGRCRGKLRGFGTR